MVYNEIPLPVKLHPAISNSINYPTAQDHTYFLNNRLGVNIMILLSLQEKAACVQLV